MRTLRARAEEFTSHRPFGLIAASLGITARAADPRARDIDRMLHEGVASEARIIEALVALVEDVCSTGPVVLALDDLQWADSSTLKVLHRLAAGVRQYPLLLCGTYRPIPRPPELDFLVRHVEATVLQLRPLPREEVDQLLSTVLGAGRAPAWPGRRRSPAATRSTSPSWSPPCGPVARSS